MSLKPYKNVLSDFALPSSDSIANILLCCNIPSYNINSKLSRCPSWILIIVSLYLNSLFIVYGFKKLLFNYNIQNNLTIILIIMIEREVKQRQKLTLKLGSLLKETLVKNNKRAGGAYKWTKVWNQGGGARFRVRGWKSTAGGGYVPRPSSSSSPVVEVVG